MNKKLPTLAQYLEAAGVDDQTSKAEIKEHRKRIKTLYHRLYGRQRRTEKVRFENTLTKTEFRKLKGFAKRYKQKSLNKFVLDCAFAYLQNESLDHDPEQTLQLLYQIRAIGNNVNQVVHGLHRERNYQTQEAYQVIKHQVDLLEQKIEKAQRHKPSLKTELEKLFKQVPESIADFERFLTEMKTKHRFDDS